MRRMPDLSVAGSAVSDLIHLVAELVENATSFSPPSTTVLVHGEPVGNGFVVEIDDRGLGMNADRMAEFNRVISDAHRLDLFQSDRLGLFVVSRLANRQSITVSLRRSPYGGTTAVVLLPTVLLTMSEPTPEADQRLAQLEQYSALLEDPAMPPRPAVTAREPGEIAPETPAIPRHAAPPEPVWPQPSTDAEPPANGHVVTAPRAGDDVAAEDSTADEPSTGGLPRRKRQASLAPGLRTDSRGSGDGTDENDPIAARISPEQALTMMSAFQQGTLRGRIAQPDDFHDT
jgi:hypothetical protein